jgi:MarR family transcriptional regulator, lower aerobic nicotinate degradation pathway regulator
MHGVSGRQAPTARPDDVHRLMHGSMSTKSISPSFAVPNEPLAIERSLNAVRSIVRALRINTRAIELQMGISLAQLFVLQQLAERSSDSLNELADRTATHQSSVSVVVRRLVERGLVSRTVSSSDKRRVVLALTEAGRTLLSGAPVTIQSQLVTGLQRMSVEDRGHLANLLEKWLLSAHIDLASPPMLGEEESPPSSATA